MKRLEWNVVVVAAALTAASGCSSDANLFTGDPDGPEAPADPEITPPVLVTVTGKWFTRCRQGDRIIDRPFDLRQSVVRALIPDDSSSTGYRIVPGSGRADGSFSIPAVPRGVIYLLNRDRGYYVTDQQVIDAHDEVPARCDPMPDLAEEETPVTFQLTNLVPYSPGLRWPRPSDNLEIVAPSLQYHNYRLSDAMVAGQTAVDMTVDWGEDWEAPLPDAAHGDEVYVFHHRSTSDHDRRNHRSVSFTELVGMFQTDVTLRSGEPAVIAGAVQPLVPNRSLSFSIDRSLFEVGYGRGIIPQGLSVMILTDRGHEIAVADMGDRSHGNSPVNVVEDRAYADPFPASWPRVSQVNYFSLRPLTTPGGSRINFAVDNFNLRSFDGAIEAGPLVSVPTGVRIGGMEFGLGGKVPFDGHSPVSVRWDAAPAVTSYRLSIRRFLPLTLEASTTVFRTTGTTLSLPATVFEDGAFYMFTLTAFKATNEYRKGQILPVGITSSVDLISGRFRLQSSCGDGVVNVGEDCDTAGESATCNTDCTPAACGDGLHNAAAGEDCDGSGQDTLGCGRDCSLQTCGDGDVNWLVEDCDDGDALDSGNGCSASCKYNNTCGDGRVESALEQCDTGGDSTTCNADCTNSLCGDGYVNPAAGEECDDGFFDHRRCSETCRLLGP